MSVRQRRQYPRAKVIGKMPEWRVGDLKQKGDEGTYEKSPVEPIHCKSIPDRDMVKTEIRHEGSSNTPTGRSI